MEPNYKLAIYLAVISTIIILSIFLTSFLAPGTLSLTTSYDEVGYRVDGQKQKILVDVNSGNTTATFSLKRGDHILEVVNPLDDTVIYSQSIKIQGNKTTKYTVVLTQEQLNSLDGPDYPRSK